MHPDEAASAKGDGVMFGYLLLGWLGGINTWVLVDLILDWREDLREAREQKAEQ